MQRISPLLLIFFTFLLFAACGTGNSRGIAVDHRQSCYGRGTRPYRPGAIYRHRHVQHCTYPRSSSARDVVWIPPFTLVTQPAGVDIDQNGLARCTGFVGTVTVFATAPADPQTSLANMTMTTKNVTGTA